MAVSFRFARHLPYWFRAWATATLLAPLATVAIKPLSSSDHYTMGRGNYGAIAARVVRVYSYVTGAEGIEPESVRDITDRSRVVQADAASGVTVAIPCADAGRTACVLAAFALLTPDVYAPHLVAFERGILEQYADVPLAGACKDEWGFPGRGNPRPSTTGWR